MGLGNLNLNNNDSDANLNIIFINIIIILIVIYCSIKYIFLIKEYMLYMLKNSIHIKQNVEGDNTFEIKNQYFYFRN